MKASKRLSQITGTPLAEQVGQQQQVLILDWFDEELVTVQIGQHREQMSLEDAVARYPDATIIRISQDDGHSYP